MSRIIAIIFPAVFLAGCFSQPPAPAVDRTASSQSRASSTPQLSGPGYYTVKRGDTLYRIALENGQDYRDIASWNNIANPSSIKEGQILRVISPSAGESADGAVSTRPVSTASTVEARPLDQAGVLSAPAPSGMLKREPRVGKEPYSDEAYARLNRQADGKPSEAPVAKPAESPKVESKPETPVVVSGSGPDDVAWMWPTGGKVLAPYSESGSKGIDFSGKSGDSVLAASDGKVVYAGTGLRGYGELVIVKHNGTYLSAYAHNRKILVKEGQVVTKGQKIAEMGSTDSDTVKLHFEIRKQGKPVDPAQYLPKR